MRRKLLTGGAIAALLTLYLGSPAGAFGIPEEPSTQYILDNLWILIAAVLVLFMQAGFALVEAGLTRAKSVANIMMKNLMDLSLGVLIFGAIGFAIAYGGTNALIGTEGWFLDAGKFDESGLTQYRRPGLDIKARFDVEIRPEHLKEVRDPMTKPSEQADRPVFGRLGITPIGGRR